MRVTNQMLIETVLRNLNRNQRRLESLQERLSSGKAISRPSDDPAAMLQAATARAEISRAGQYLKNIDLAETWLKTSEASLSSIVSVMERARTLAVQGGSDTLSANERLALVAEVRELLNQAIEAGNATHQGYYIFGGFKTNTAPFTLESGPPPSVTYNGDSGTMLRQIDSGVNLAINAPGNAAFPDVFDSLIGLRNDLETGNTENIRTTRLGQLDSALDAILSLRGEVGAKVNHLESTALRLHEAEVNLKALLSKAEDIDVAEAILNLSTQETVYKAALAAAGRTLQTSLLDFLR